MKKAVYFTIDSMIGGSLIIIIIILSTTFYMSEQVDFQKNYLSKDLIESLSVMTVSETSNRYIEILIDDSTIQNMDNTVLEQITEFWADDEMMLANETARNITINLVPENYGYGIYINNESIYTRDRPLKKSLVVSKKVISGIQKGELGGSYTRQDPPALWGPTLFEVRIWE